jgi:hypothetical protein
VLIFSWYAAEFRGVVDEVETWTYLAAVLGSGGSIGSAGAPPRLSYATYVGAPGGSVVSGFAVDSAGYAYPLGTSSGCEFLTKLNQAGTAAVWSVCLPMYQVDAVALNAAGYIYVVGGSQPSPSGVGSAVVVELSPDAQQVVYSTSIQGASAAKLALDSAGNAYVLEVPDTSFNATPGAYLTKGGVPSR